jgi:chromosome segregation ATPase
MNKLLQSILLVAIAAIVAILLYRWVFPSGEEVEKLKKEIQDTQALVDSLRQVNQTLLDANLALRQAETLIRARNDSLQEVSHEQKVRLAQLGRRARFFPGAPDSLHRDLNRLAGVPVPVCPE